MNTLIQLHETGSDVTHGTDQSPAKIVLRSQSPSDQEVIQKICPLDQERHFIGRWNGFNYELTEQPKAKGKPEASPGDPEEKSLADEIAKCKALSEGKLKTLAAQRGVPWDIEASAETMVERVAKAKK